MQTNPLLATFNFADINGVKIGFLRQLFLTQACELALLADGLSKNL